MQILNLFLYYLIVTLRARIMNKLLLLILSIPVAALANPTHFDDLKKACTDNSGVCKSITRDSGNITIHCQDGSSTYVYTPAEQTKADSGTCKAKDLGKVSTGEPSSGSYYCTPNHPPYSKPADMIKSYCKKKL
jgi:hypothetical protein